MSESARDEENPALQVQSRELPDPLPDVWVLRGHCRHASTDVAASKTLYLPGSQSSHILVSVPLRYFPGVHAVQGPPSGPINPRLQIHSVERIELAGESEFDVQSVHDASDKSGLNFPA